MLEVLEVLEEVCLCVSVLEVLEEVRKIWKSYLRVCLTELLTSPPNESYPQLF